MILFLDIENTIIDNLADCNWLEENCKKIKDFNILLGGGQWNFLNCKHNFIH